MTTMATQSIGASLSSKDAFQGFSGGDTGTTIKLIPESSRPASPDPIDIVAGILRTQEKKLSPAEVKKARATLTATAAACKTRAGRRRR